MMAYDNRNTLKLFTNKYKQPGDKKPDMRGFVQLDADTLTYLNAEVQAGREPKLEVALWNNRARNGAQYTSGKVGIPQQHQQAGTDFQAPSPEQYQTDNNPIPKYMREWPEDEQKKQSEKLDDDIPF